MKLTKLVILIILLKADFIFAQSRIVLQEAIDMAQRQSRDFKISKSFRSSGQLNYNTYRSSLLPSLSLSGTMPSYNRIINKVTLPNGEDTFISQNQGYSVLNLNLMQNVGLTGGVLALSSSLSRIDIFGKDSESARNYSSSPFHISYYQNNFFYNPLKWQRKLAPLYLEESNRAFAESMEQIAINTTEKYFNLLQMQVQIALDLQNYLNADTLLRITEKKFSIGTRDKNDILQAKLNLLSARNSLTRNTIQYKTMHRSFMEYLCITHEDSLVLEIPDRPKQFVIDPVIAISKAYENRKEIISNMVRKISMDQKVAQIKSEITPSVGFSAAIGVSKSDSDLLKVYQSLEQQQAFALQFRIPILDWGQNRNRMRITKEENNRESLEIEKALIAFEEEIQFNAMEWNSLSDRLQIAKETESAASERFLMAKQRYILGSISFLEFADAQQQKDAAVGTYVNSLFYYWNGFFLMRRLTLYDFIEKKNLSQLRSLE